MKKGNRKEYLLRIDQELWNDLNEWAGQEFRSVNGQIELLLQRAVDERRKKNKPAVEVDNTSKKLVKQSR